MANNYNKFNEKALLLLVYSFLEKAIKEGKIGINKEYGVLKDKSIKLFTIYKKFYQTRKSFANFKVHKYLLQRIKDPSNKYHIDIVYVALLLLYFYRLSDIKRTISPLSVKEAKELVEAIKEDLNEDEIIVASNFFKAIYPEKEETIEFFVKRLKEKIKN